MKKFTGEEFKQLIGPVQGGFRILGADVFFLQIIIVF